MPCKHTGQLLQEGVPRGHTHNPCAEQKPQTPGPSPPAAAASPASGGWAAPARPPQGGDLVGPQGPARPLAAGCPLLPPPWRGCQGAWLHRLLLGAACAALLLLGSLELLLRVLAAEGVPRVLAWLRVLWVLPMAAPVSCRPAGNETYTVLSQCVQVI